MKTLGPDAPATTRAAAFRGAVLPVLAAALVMGLAACAAAAPRKGAVPPASILPDSSRNLVVIEFRDSPTQGMIVTGGMLAVPDSGGRFGSEIVRYQPGPRNPGARGFGDGDRLVFTDLEPGTYRLALIDLEESGTVHRFITKQAAESFNETCRVYSDSIPALTFSLGHGEARHLGRLVRRLRPALGGAELWQTSFDWEAVDERRSLRDLMKRKRLAPWRDLMGRRLAALNSTPTPPAPPR